VTYNLPATFAAGDLGCFSFQATKSLNSGEVGAGNY
jgi:dTDP-4-amino-4,6-dideoxygalactose transaminase